MEMTYLEKLLTVYVSVKVLYIVFATVRDCLHLHEKGMRDYFNVEKKTLLMNIEVERSRTDEWKRLFTEVQQKLIEKNKKEIKK